MRLGMKRQSDAQRNASIARRWLAATTTLLLLAVPAGVWYWREIATPKPELRFAFNSYPGSLPPVLAEQLGYFRGGACKITLVQDNEHADAFGRFASGVYSGITTTLGSAIASTAVIPQARIVYLKDESSGADVVLADRSIRSLGELRGKKVGVMIGDFGEFWLGRLLARAGLSLDEVEVVHTTGSKVPERIRGGEIVAGHTWSPYREEGLALGQVEIATTASDPLTIVDVVLMNGDLLATEPECARHFLRGWSEAVVFWRRHPNEAVRLLKQALPHATSLSLEGITLLDMQESAERMRLERLDELMRAHAVFYRMRGVAVPEAGLAQLLDRRPVEDLLMEKRHP
jgi:NitT/TauT family transport system substrate-binding protein